MAAIHGAVVAAQASQDRLNAFTSIESADSLPTELPRGPLAGVPIALKDLIDHAGRITTCGSSFYRHHATESAPVVDRLEAAGATVIGRTGLHEFAFGFSSENPWFGPVKNPWNEQWSPGGSSGGSAAAVAAGIVPVALGTDTGGSVRVPAALCGIVGLKVTHGRIPLRGVFPLVESLDTVGPLARTVDHAALAYRVMAGHDPHDPWSVPAADTTPRPVSHLRGLRIGVPQPWVAEAPMTLDVHAAFTHCLRQLEDLGASVREIDVPLLLPPGSAGAIIGGEAGPLHRAWFGDPDKRYGEDVEERLADAMAVTVDDYVAARRWQAALRHQVDAVWDTVDVLVTPTTAARHKIIGADTVDVDGSRVHYRTVLAWFTALVNQTGLPALAIPLVQPGEPPPSLQLIGPRWSEDRLLEIGRRLERLGVAGFRDPSVDFA